ncbi:MAG: hypothetical protein HY736_12300 [Verrucomicrobia bacterium]|nr:hypothetical protein [Verrucomicrobiota bacterium]
MNPFLKIILILVAAVIAVKLLPLTLALGCIFAAALAVFALVGVSLVAVLLCLGLLLAALLSPIWIPLLALVGLIALIKRGTRAPA